MAIVVLGTQELALPYFIVRQVVQVWLPGSHILFKSIIKL